MLYLTLGIYLFAVSIALQREHFFNFNCTLVLLFLALNQYNGFDWISYYHLYANSTLTELVSLDGLIQSTSPGFLLVLAIAKMLGSYNFVFVISSLLFIIAVRALAKEYQNRNIILFLCFCFFGYYYYIERIKQGFAISLIILAISLLLRRKRPLAWISMACAIAFHSSALLAIPILLFPYGNQPPRKTHRVAGTAIILVFAGLFYFTVPLLISILPPPLSYYAMTYSTKLTSGFNFGFFLSLGGLSFVFMLLIMYRISATSPPIKERNYSYFIYFFSYITSPLYGFIRISNFYYPYMIHSLSHFCDKRRTGNALRSLVLIGAMVQLLRPLSVSYYSESIMNYQIWGISEKTPKDMQYIRCKSVYAHNTDNELADYSCGLGI